MSYGLWEFHGFDGVNLRGVPHARTHVAIIAFLVDSGIPAPAQKEDGGKLAVSTSASVPFVPISQH